MIKLKTNEEIAVIKAGGKRLADVLHKVAARVAPGVKTCELDEYAAELIKKLGDKSAFKNYRPEGSPLAYPAHICVSVNDTVVHGIPSNRELKEGDIVAIDLGLKHENMFTDMAVTVPVGNINPELRKLINVTREALERGIKAAVPGNTLGDIGAAIENCVASHNYGLVTELSGHGVGFALHEDPYVPNYGEAGKGMKLEPGLVIAIEPMVCLGTGNVIFDKKDGFTFRTKDGKPSAHFEHTIAITEKGPVILTE